MNMMLNLPPKAEDYDVNIVRKGSESEGKAAIASTTVWGSVIAILPYVGKLLEYIGVLPLGSVDILQPSLASAIGGILAVYGRMKADKPITGVLKAK